MEKLIIRKAEIKDIPQIMELIRELAVYEKAAHEVSNTEERMLREGFEENPAFVCGLAETKNEIVGIYIWYYRYSTWKGKGIYLEDIVVKESYRNQGIGTLLMKACIEDAKNENAPFLTWQVLDWNEPAIAFYKKFNAHFDGEWINVKLNAQQIQNN